MSAMENRMEGFEMTYQKIAENMASIVYMNRRVMELGNEDAEEIWLMTYPDGADHEDILEMAKDPQMMEWLYEDYQRIMLVFS